MHSRQVVTAALLLGLATSLPAIGQITQVSTPTAPYISGTTLLGITPANSASVTSLTNGTQTLTFSGTMTAGTVGVNWSTWGSPPNTESATPRVVQAVSGVLPLTISLSSPTTTFGFEVEPNNNGTYSISVAYYNGATLLGTVTRSVAGSFGALLAAGTSGGSPITSVVITADAGAGGLALAQFRYAGSAVVVPALSTSALCGLAMLLAAAGSLLARRRNGLQMPQPR